MPDPQRLDLSNFAEPVDVQPGREIRLKGSFRSADGATIDAATTTWPEGAPGGSSIDAGGLVDFKNGGFHVVSRDPVSHEVVAVATGEDAPACAVAGVSAPCLPLRTVHLARSRFMTREEFRESMKGAITIELVDPPPPVAVPAYVPVQNALTSPFAVGAYGVVALFAIVGLVLMTRRRRAQSPEGRMRTLAARVERKLRTCEAELRATLEPVVKKTLVAVSSGRLDAKSREGLRVADVLARVETRIDEMSVEKRAAEEQRAADELVLEMETALEAARETAAL
ncbi:MAG: hypothetical protein HOW73_15965 [Polyangiaceae bacterium]|nr:hypothetical protein [Polyangiaceae bacterium]